MKKLHPEDQIPLRGIPPPVFVRNPYGYDRDLASADSALYCDDPSLAQQSAAEESDINVIVRRFGLTGQLPVGLRAPTYGDFGDQIFDFQSAMNAVRQADESFMRMPAQVRSRFHNSTQEFVDFCSDEGNRAEAEKLGLVIPKPVVDVPIQTAPAVDSSGKAASVVSGDGKVA